MLKQRAGQGIIEVLAVIAVIALVGAAIAFFAT